MATVMDKQKTLSEDMCTNILISKTVERKIEMLKRRHKKIAGYFTQKPYLLKNKTKIKLKKLEKNFEIIIKSYWVYIYIYTHTHTYV